METRKRLANLSRLADLIYRAQSREMSELRGQDVRLALQAVDINGRWTSIQEVSPEKFSEFARLGVTGNLDRWAQRNLRDINIQRARNRAEIERAKEKLRIGFGRKFALEALLEKEVLKRRKSAVARDWG